MEPNVRQTIHEMALSLPGMIEGTSHGMPSYKLKDTMMMRFHEDGKSLVLKMDLETREILLQTEPEVYCITNHFKNYAYVLVRIDQVDLRDLRGHLLAAWRVCAPKKLQKEFNL